MNTADYENRGWCRFSPDPELIDWLRFAGPAALATRHDPAMAQQWLRCAGTWFVGVNALANDAAGVIGRSGPLGGRAMRFVRESLEFGDIALDRAQVSIFYPGYPKQGAAESAAAFRFRRDRDAAHVDGLHPVGPERRRKIGEFQGFLLGIPINVADENAAPLVIWEGSHKIMHRALGAALAGTLPDEWPEIDLTHVYHDARRTAFETCPRVVVHANPGAAYLLHRMALHGVAPWATAAQADPSGRAILYFRPEIDRKRWLADDPSNC